MTLVAPLASRGLGVPSNCLPWREQGQEKPDPAWGEGLLQEPGGADTAKPRCSERSSAHGAGLGSFQLREGRPPSWLCAVSRLWL